MSISKGLLVSFGEKKTYQILEKWSGHVKVFTKVRFFDVIDWSSLGITSAERSYLEKTHFDFVISEPEEPLKPLFAVEFDGISKDFSHIDPYRELKKETKSRICAAEGFSVLWLEFDEIKEINGETILDSILENYVGGEWIDDLKARGEAPATDAYASVFRPTVILLDKYNPLLMEVGIENFSFHGDWVEAKCYVRFKTDIGMGRIERFARVRNINFPHFSSVIFVEDVATYECLNAFDRYVRQGKFVVNDNIVYTKLFCSERPSHD